MARLGRIPARMGPRRGRGRAGDGIAEMERGYAAVGGTGSNFNSSARACLAATYLKEGRAADALALADEECAVLEETGARAFEAELHRIAGEALGLREGPAAAEARLRHALEVARRRGGLALKLRAADQPGAFLDEHAATRPGRTTCWRRSTHASRKASTRPTSSRPGRCSTRSPGDQGA